MGIEKVYTCDLCEESTAKGQLVTLRVGLRDWRLEDYVPVDVGPNCQSRPASEVIAFAKDTPEWKDQVH